MLKNSFKIPNVILNYNLAPVPGFCFLDCWDVSKEPHTPGTTMTHDTLTMMDGTFKS